MKIGFDAKRGFNNFSGLGNYSRVAIESLAQYYPDENYFLFATDRNNKLFEQIQFRKSIETIYSSSLLKSYWRSYSQVNDWKKLKIDLFHGLSNELPFGLNRAKTKTIVTIHDVIFKKHPEFYSFVDRIIYDIKTKHACIHSDKIICVSEQTKKEVMHFYKVPDSKIKVIYASLPSHITRMISVDKTEEVKTRFRLPEKFLLYVGTIEKRKNLLTIIKALNNLRAQHLPLVVVGKPTKYLKEIKNYLHDYAPHLKIIFIHDAGNEDLNVIYSLAFVFIYTSLIEGFGIPLIEAATHGVPSITSRDSCMEEAAGKGAIYIDPKSESETASAISRLINEPILHKQLSALAIAHSAKFNSKRLADELMNLYKENNEN